jgi:signal transduction histidine kinase
MEKEESMVLAIFSASLFITLFTLAAIVAMVSLVLKRRKVMIEKRLLEENFQQELLSAGLEMQEHTFQSVSREIHDNVGQILSLAKLNLNILSMEGGDTKKVLGIKELVAKAINELRNLGMGYHADRLLDKGLLPGIQYQVELLQRTGLYKVTYQSAFDILYMSKSKTIFIYRIVQEIVQNIVRHSGASEVDISICRHMDGIAIIISDNGKGFNREEPDFEPGLGLSNMAQRACMIGAKLEIKSEEGNGTIISLICKQNGDD